MKEKYITIEEKFETEDSNSDSYIRKFKLEKFNARTSIKITKLLAAKIIPAFDQVVSLLQGDKSVKDLPVEEILAGISFEKFAEALDLITDDDLDKLIDVALTHCYEVLPAGPIPVLNKDRTYGVPNIEDDPVIVLRLTVEALYFSVMGFFNESRLRSILLPLADSFGLNA